MLKLNKFNIFQWIIWWKALIKIISWIFLLKKIVLISNVMSLYFKWFNRRIYYCILCNTACTIWKLSSNGALGINPCAELFAPSKLHVFQDETTACFWLSFTAKNFTEHQASCRALKGYLAYIPDVDIFSTVRFLLDIYG